MKKKIAIIVSAIVVVLLIVGIIVYLNMRPYLNAAEVVKRLISEDYTYDIECYIEGVTIEQGKFGTTTIYVEGEKYDKSLRGYIYSEKETYLEVFANTDKEVVFNIKPTCDFISNKLEEVLGISVGDLVIDMEDTYVTLEEIEKIVELDVVSMDDYETKESSKKTGKYKLAKGEEPDEMNVDYDADDSNFFELILEDYDIEVVIGVPEDEKEECVYVRMEKDDTIVEMCMEYEVGDVEEIEFPESSFEEEDIEKFKKIYKMWIVGKAAYDKLFGPEE